MKYQVIENKFHGGNVISEHRSLKVALQKALKHRCFTCTCGGPAITGIDYDIFKTYDYCRLCLDLSKAQAIDIACSPIGKNYGF